MDKKAQTRLRVQRYRERAALQGIVTEIPENVTQSPDSVTISAEDVTQDVTRITFADDSSVLDLEALERNREKLTKLCNFMKSDDKFKKYMKDIRFGIFGCTLDRIGQVLEVVW